MALELASKSVIFHQKLEENDQIIDLVPSRVLPIPPPQRESELAARILGNSYIEGKKTRVFTDGLLGYALGVLECGDRLEYHIGISV